MKMCLGNEIALRKIYLQRFSSLAVTKTTTASVVKNLLKRPRNFIFSTSFFFFSLFFFPLLSVFTLKQQRKKSFIVLDKKKGKYFLTDNLLYLSLAL